MIAYFKIKWLEFVRNKVLLILYFSAIIIATMLISASFNDRISIETIVIGIVNDDQNTISDRIIKGLESIDEYTIVILDNKEIQSMLVKQKCLIIYQFPKDWTKEWLKGTNPPLKVYYLSGESLAPFMNEQVISLGMMDFIRSSVMGFDTNHFGINQDNRLALNQKMANYEALPYDELPIKIEVVSPSDGHVSDVQIDRGSIYRRILLGMGFFLIIVSAYIPNIIFWQEYDDRLISRLILTKLSFWQRFLAMTFWKLVRLMISLSILTFYLVIVEQLSVSWISIGYYVLFSASFCLLLTCFEVSQENTLIKIKKTPWVLLIISLLGNVFFDLSSFSRILGIFQYLIPTSTFMDWFYQFMIFGNKTPTFKQAVLTLSLGLFYLLIGYLYTLISDKSVKA